MQRQCKCWDVGLKPNMSYEQLTEFVRSRKMCSDPNYICPSVDKELRRAEKEKRQREQYHKQLRRKGLTKDEIDNKQMRSRTRSKEVAEVSFDFVEPTRRRVKAS